jgi:hypothetical protein
MDDSRVPDAVQRFFSGASQSRDPGLSPVLQEITGVGSAKHHAAKDGVLHRAREHECVEQTPRAALYPLDVKEAARCRSDQPF